MYVYEDSNFDFFVYFSARLRRILPCVINVAMLKFLSKNGLFWHMFHLYQGKIV